MRVQFNCDSLTEEPGVAISFATGANFLFTVAKHPGGMCGGCGSQHPPYFMFSIYECDPDDDGSQIERMEGSPFLSFTMDERDAAHFVALASGSIAKADPTLLAEAIDWVHEQSPC